MGKFCKNCGNPMKENEKFCAKCGTKSDTAKTSHFGSEKEANLSMAGSTVNKRTSPMAGTNIGTKAVLLSGGSRSSENVYKLLLVIISVLMIISALVPYLETLGQTMSLFSADDKIKGGILYIGLAVICIVGAGMGKAIVTAVTGALAGVLCCYEIYQVNSAYEKLSIFSGIVTKKAGFYLMIITSISMLIVGVLYYIQGRRR